MCPPHTTVKLLTQKVTSEDVTISAHRCTDRRIDSLPSHPLFSSPWWLGRAIADLGKGNSSSGFLRIWNSGPINLKLVSPVPLMKAGF